MSTPSVGRGRRKAWLLATLLGAFGLFLTLGAGNAFAVACQQLGATVYIQLGNETAVVSKGSLSRIMVNGAQCGAATVSNTDTIVAADVSTNGLSTLVIDESGGRFEPGLTPEPQGLNEIEWDLAFINTVVVQGNAAADTINVGDGDAVGPVGNPYVNLTGDLGALTIVTDSGPPPVTAPINDGVPETGIINLNGDDDADVFVDSVADFFPDVIINGNAGNDTITAKGGLGTGPTTDVNSFDVLSGIVENGGPGDDSLQGGDGNDLFSGGDGNDVIDGDDSQLEFFGGGFCSNLFNSAGNPDISFLQGDTVTYAAATGPITADLDPKELHPGLATGEGTDVLQNIENIQGSPAGDTLSGDNNSNVILGNGGDDTIAGDAGNDCELGQDGNDTFDENEGTSLAQGGNGTNNGADLMLGGAGLDDTVDYSSRSTRIDVFLEPIPNLGVPGNSIFSNNFCGEVDFISTELRPAAAHRQVAAHRNAHGIIVGVFSLTFDGADLNGNGTASDSNDEFDCVFLDTENAKGGSGNDILDANFLANRADNEFTGNGGNDLEVGGAGNDTFHEGAAPNGADDMDGGTGADLCDYSQRTGNLNVSIDGSDNDGEAGEGDNCGGVVAGPLAFALVFDFDNDTVTTVPFPGEGQPSSPQNTENINGGSGADVLTGNDQQNVLNGNAGNDVLSGLGGPDSLSGGDGDDVLSGGSGNDASDGGAGTDTVDESSGGSAGVGVVINLSTGQLSGDGNDTLTGLENATGSSFTDSIRGDAGNNVLNGRGGNDAIQGADGDDTINGGDGADELGGGAGNDSVAGSRGNDTARGGAGDDSVSGGPGADTLIGGGGDDLLSGGSGKDIMRGGPGSDRCVPGAPGFANGDVATGCES